MRICEIEIETYNSTKIFMMTNTPVEDIIEEKYGGASLINRLYKSLNKENEMCFISFVESDIKIAKEKEVNFFYVGFSLYSLFKKIVYGSGRKAISKSSKKVDVEETRWVLSLILNLFEFILLKVDPFLKMDFTKMADRKKVLLIFNSPFQLAGMERFLKNTNVNTLLFKHNIEWIFFSQLVENRIVASIFIPLLKKIEIMASRNANFNIALSDYDKEVLINEGIDRMSIRTVNIYELYKEKDDAEKVPKKNISLGIKDKFLVCYLGSNFKPNIVASKNILDIAKRINNDNVQFLIVGSVSDAFKNYEIPKNVTFMGFVPNLHDLLNSADIFINPDTFSKTGVATKVASYLAVDKPILSTEYGMRGYQYKELENCIIENNIDMYISWIEFFYNKKRA